MVQQIGKVFFVITTLLVLILGTADWMRGKNAFFLQGIEVEGNHLLSKEKVLEPAQIDSTQDLFDLHPDEIAERIKNQNPLIKDVDVSRKLPGVVKINVQESTPVAFLEHKGKYWGIDSEGALLIGVAPSYLYDLPVITGIELNQNKAGQYHFNAGFPLVLDCLRELQQKHHYLASQISEIQYHPQSGLILYLIQNTIPIILGKYHFADRLNNLEIIYSQNPDEVKSTKTQYVDLRIDSQVIIRHL